MDLQLVESRPHELARAADVALTKPGTVTLEVALLGTPQVVVARVPALSAFLTRRLVKTRFWAMPNLIAGAEVVPELLQERAEPACIADAASANESCLNEPRIASPCARGCSAQYPRNQPRPTAGTQLPRRLMIAGSRPGGQ